MALKVLVPGHRPEPDDLVRAWPENAIELSVFDAVPDRLPLVGRYEQLTAPRMVCSEMVAWTGPAEPALRETAPDEPSTDVTYGRLLTVMLFTRVTPEMCGVQLLNVCAVSDSPAVPPAAGLLVTEAVNCETVQLTLELPETNVAVVPLFRLAVTTSPTATFGPPTEPVVRTFEPAALAGDARNSPAAATVSSAAADRANLRMVLPFWDVVMGRGRDRAPAVAC